MCGKLVGILKFYQDLLCFNADLNFGLQYLVSLMKSAYEAPKDVSQDLLRQILDQNTSLNSMDPIMISQISNAFKVVDNPIADRVIRISKIKQKLIDIIIDEKQQCVNYLTLPKFKSLSENSKNLLKEATLSTWTTYTRRYSDQQKNKKCQKYFFRTENLKQAQEFHLGFFQLLKSVYFYQNPYFPRPMGNYPPMMHPQEAYPYQFFPPMPNNQNVKVEEPKGGMIDQYSQNREGKKFKDITETYKENSKNLNERGENKQRIKQRQKSEHDKSKKKQMKQLLKNKISQKDSLQPAPFYKQFSQCCCKGKKSPKQKFFQCSQCQKQYHLICLCIPGNAIEKPGVKKICPLCSLKNTNALYNVIQTLQTFWSDDKQLHKQKISIKNKKCKQISEKKYSIQFRFTKVEGKSMFMFNNSSYNVKQQENAEKQQKCVLNQVIIKDQILVKGNGQDVKISLQCFKNPDSRAQDKRPTLLFVVINVVKPKTLQQILKTEYEYFEDNYLDKFLGNKDEIRIEIQDTAFNIISIPVRGSDCQHVELYDLQQIAKNCIDLHSDKCFYCSKKCRTFKIDRRVQQQIQRIKKQIPNPKQYPQAIIYRRDGTFKWEPLVKPQVNKSGEANIGQHMYPEFQNFSNFEQDAQQSDMLDEDEEASNAKNKNDNEQNDMQ